MDPIQVIDTTEGARGTSKPGWTSRLRTKWLVRVGAAGGISGVTGELS
jgi:hypothetical protein